jgi:curved DNA-binding protein
MDDADEFIDFYRILQVEPTCDGKTLESAYRYFAKLYHPDHAATADVDRFSAVTQAYAVLRSPEKRAEYDQVHSARFPDSFGRQPSLGVPAADEKTVLNDAEIHERILFHLYKRRREHAYDAGVVGWLLQEMLGCSDDSFEFHVWYLKSKGLLDVTEQGTLAITIQGVDHVISTSRATAAEKLLLTQDNDAQDLS